MTTMLMTPEWAAMAEADAANVATVEAQKAALTQDDPDFILMQHGPFFLTKTGVIVAGELTPPFDLWEASVQWCQQAEAASPFWVGDLLAYGEATYGETYAQAMDATKLAYGTLANAAWVARHVAPAQRHPALAFTMHQEVAPLSPAEQQHWLDAAETQQWTRQELRTAIKVAASQTVPTHYWLTVQCQDANDLATLTARMQAEGRAIKPHVTPQ